MERTARLIASALSGIFLVQAPAPGSHPHVFGDPPITQRAPSRTYHVENYKLILHFDQAKGEVFGDESVTLRPLAAGFTRFYLNASELKIDSVALEPADGKLVALKFETGDPRLWITLDRAYSRSEDLHLRIVYHGFPRTGLFFVNPNANYPKWPKEIWSQGEPEFNRHWFPCWDYPNDMSTSEVVATVPDGQSVVSNGKLIKVTHHARQTTYDWVESIPHSSYLISIAIGPWRKVTDHYKDIPVDYYVPEQVNEATVRRSFRLTPDMLGFFSHATGVEYPYEQYAQTTVYNFIFGGQENVSATTLSDRTLHDERADPDYPSQSLVAHEMGQHWFGDLVQGRDWNDIWLNEGFATYMDALYTQYHQGNDAFRLEIMNDQLVAQQQDREGIRRPIVYDRYAYPLQMLDNTTHQKGAAVLDMLRNMLDGTRAESKPASQSEPLFKALNAYLRTYRGHAVETADLIKTVQAATGKNLDWFFREWVFMAGNPDYKVQAKYDPDKQREEITVLQTQQTNALTPIFDMPIELAFYGADGKSKHTRIRDNQRTQVFNIPIGFEPRWVDFDPDGIIDKTVDFEQPLDALIAKAELDPTMMSRFSAVQQLGGVKGAGSNSAVAELTRVLGKDAFYGVRRVAAASLGQIGGNAAKAALLTALNQPDSRVRVAGVQALAGFHKDQSVYAALAHALHNDSSYAVEAAAAEGLGSSGDPEAFSILQAAAATESEVHVMGGVFAGLAATGDARAGPILLTHARAGVPEQLRLSALAALSEISGPGSLEKNDRQALSEVVRAALHDPLISVQQAGEQLAGKYDLNEFRAEIQAQAQTAPMAFERDASQKVLSQLH
jgi:aminopeptidase N